VLKKMLKTRKHHSNGKTDELDIPDEFSTDGVPNPTSRIATG